MLSKAVLYCRERISRLLLMLADEQREVHSITEGHIAVAVGLKQVQWYNDIHLSVLYQVARGVFMQYLLPIFGGIH